MNNDRFKFRAWDGKEMVDLDIEDVAYHLDLMSLTTECLVQSTGRKDKNGKLIFEKDILGTEDKEEECHGNVRVVFDENAAAFMVTEELNNPFCDEYLSELHIGYWEIIGNIHEHPHLLEAGE